MKRSAFFGLALLLALPAGLFAEEFTVDAVHSSVMFRIKHLSASYAYGRFNAIAGKFDLDAPEGKGGLSIEIKIDSIDTANAARDKHLKAADYFDAAKFPSATFKSTSVKAKGKDEYEVAGDMTIRGKTKPVAFTLTKTGQAAAPPQMGGGTLQGFEAMLTIRRSDFGVGMMPEQILGEEVKLLISIEGHRK